jgi:hypothetical protein
MDSKFPQSPPRVRRALMPVNTARDDFVGTPARAPII